MPEVAGLTFEGRDEFDRKVVADSLLRLLRSDLELTPALLHGGWGSGKTEFCKKLINLHCGGDEAGSMRLVHIDAFKSDHAGEPLLTMLSAVLSLMEERDQEVLRRKALPYLRFGLKTAGKAAAGWLLKSSTEGLGESLASELEQSAESAIDATAEVLLKSHEEAEQSLQMLRDALVDVAAKAPLVLFIDELDRCKPDFAVSMLETVKHVFDVPNLKIVFVTNVIQLEASIRHCYGVDVDAADYLGKFFKFRFQLPALAERDGANPVFASVKYFQELVRRSEWLAPEDNWGQRFAEDLVGHNGLSLRDVERFVRQLELVHLLTEGRDFRMRTYGNSLLMVLTVFAHCFSPEYLHVKIEQLNVEGLLSLLPMKGLEAFPADGCPSNTDVVSAMLICDPNLHSKARAESEAECRAEWSASIKKYMQHTWDDPLKAPSIQVPKYVSLLQLTG